MNETGPFLRRLPLVGVLGVLTLSVAGSLYLGGSRAVFLPVAALAGLLAASRLFSHPVHVLATFLLVVVNLDHFKIGGGAISLDILLSSALMALLLMRAAFLVPRTTSAYRPLEIAFAIFLVGIGLSVVGSVIPAESIKRYGREFEYLVIVLLLLRHPLTRSELRVLMLAMVFSSVVPCLVGIAAYAFHIDAYLGQELYLENLYQGEARVRSTLSHPVVFSLYLAVTLTITSGLWMARALASRWITGPLALLQCTALFLTYGRSGWVAFATAFITLLILRGRKRLLALGAPLLAFALWRLIPNFGARWDDIVSSNQENSLFWRFGLWAYALSKFPEKPIFGSGLGTFLEHVDYLQGFNSHQTWTGLLVETGLVGALSFLALVLVVSKGLRQALRATDPESKPVVQIAVAAWVGILVGSLASDPFSMPSATVYLWTLVAVALRISLTPESGSNTLTTR